MKKELLIAIVMLFTTQFFAQTAGVSTFYEQNPGDNRQYIEYIPGNLPIIISAPHGGVKQSGQTIGSVFYPDNDSTLPDRSCGTNERDDNTEILIREIQAEIFALTGCYAHVIINNLHRSKLDPNREVNEAACGDSDAIDHWNGWHSFIDQASASVEANWGKGLYIDLHGQSHSIARIELGYNISASNLNNADLTGASIINNSTIKNLVSNNIGSLNSEQLVRGNESLGAKLKNVSATFYNNNVNPGCGVTSGYRAIPSNFDSGASDSCDDTRPFGNSYFSGDFYNNRRHGSGPTASDGAGGGGTVDGIMSEVNRRVRDLGTYQGAVFDTRPQTLVPFAKDYAAVILDYIDTHYNDFAVFNYSSNTYDTSDPNPTPVVSGLTNGVFTSTAGLSLNASSGEVDLSNSTAGSYSITYTVGSCGYYNTAQTVEITSVQPDTTAPVITLIGNSTIDLNVGDTYNELGANASDNVDGDLTGSIVIDDSNVDTANAGTYAVTYNVSDAAGNAATEVSRTVNVTVPPDTTAPVITLIGNSTIDLNVGDTYNELGATASDNVDGDLTGSIVIDDSNVDTANAGTYAVTYNVSDAAGNAATEVSRTINVNVPPDTTAPVITLIGNSTIDLNVGDTYNELGANATDNVDGDLTGSIVIDDSNVDTANAGTYAVTYNVSDAAGNAATEVSRTINVNVPPDTTAPVITLIGNSTIDLNVGDTYNELGANATDNVDGDLTGSIVIDDSNVDTANAGTYAVTYNVSDAAGNAATEVSRTINVNVPPDTTAPVITLIGNATIDLNVGDTYNELGANATDNVDGDLTGSIVIDDSNVDTANAGTYAVTYNVSDAAGNAATEVSRTINVNVPPDTTAPVITLIGNSTIDLNVGDTYNELGANATDNVDGDLTGSIVIDDSNVDTANAGTYAVTYNVSDAAGNAATEVSRTINVNVPPDTTAPVITLIGNATIDLNVGDTYNELGANATDNVDGDLTGSIVIDDSNVDTANAGTYAVTYNVSDAAGNAATEVSRTINVNVPPDTTAPVITLIGNATIDLNVGDTYNELGANATDNVDGDLTGSIVINDSNVDTANAGTYAVTYNVSDAAGNAATEVSRTINVNVPPDTTAPVITLIGNATIDLNVGDTYNELGANATDNVDGDLTGSIVIDDSNVDTANAGTYAVTYNVSDAAGNAATEVSRTVNVTVPPDTTAPVITLIGNSTIDLNVGDTYNELGANATDNVDGDLTGSIVIDDSNVDTANAGTYAVTYNVSDAAGNAATEVSRTINVTVPPDTTAPTAPTNLIASGTTETTTDLSWTAATDNIDVTGYDIYQDTNLLATISGTTYQVSGLTANTSYSFIVKAKDAAGNESADSNIASITTDETPLVYCSSNSTNVNDEFISRVQLNTIDNSSGAQFYSDFTSVSTTLTKDSQYTITVTPTWTGTVYNEAYSVWIDYNRDGDFTDAGEQVWTQGNTQATTVSGNFTIPSSAIENSTRMRVSMKYNGIPSSCETFTWGEVEDYTVTIQSAAPDTTAPIITLNGPSTINLNVGDTYNEQGATAADDVDGDLTSSIVINSNVDTANAGTYAVTYNVSDAAGNAATEVSRTVNVTVPPDTTAPVITLLGPSTIDLDVGDTYSEQGATATDNVDGDLTSSIVISGNVNTSTAGTYILNYNVSDAAGNAANEISRTVNVNQPDVTAPVITLIGNSVIDLNVGDTYNEQGATATDNIDGDLTSSIVINSNVDTANAGTYAVTYNVSDASGNAATEVSRTVNVTVPPDTTAPVITLLGPSTIDLDVGDTYSEQGATATDNVDGDLTSNIVISGNVDTSTVGTYVLNYNVSDAAGNAANEVSRTVTVNQPDITAPVITLNGNAIIDLNVGDTYNEQGATATDNIDGDLTASIVINDNVDTANAGTYTVTYNVSDAAGNAATEVSRTVNVTVPPDTTAPVITLLGPSTIDLDVGDTYSEQGATATDNVDGDLTSSIVISGNVNTSTAGTYILNYNVSDAAGNAANEVSRTVTVNQPSTDPIVLHEGYFETGWDGWQDGGSDCYRYSGSRSFEGSYSIRIRDNSGTGSAMTSESFDLTSFDQVEVAFHFYPNSMETNEDFWLRFNNGSGWTTIKTWTRGVDFNNNTFYSATVTLDNSQYSFGNSSQFRFQNDASGNADRVYIDQVIITGLSGGSPAREQGDSLIALSVLDTDDEFGEEDFIIYPNPVKGDILNIKMPPNDSDVDVLSSYRVINMMGQLVLSGNFNDRIKVGSLRAGVYFIEVNDGEETTIKRFIKE